MAAHTGTDRDLHEAILSHGDDAALYIGREQAKQAGLSEKELQELFDDTPDGERD